MYANKLIQRAVRICINILKNRSASKEPTDLFKTLNIFRRISRLESSSFEKDLP